MTSHRALVASGWVVLLGAAEACSGSSSTPSETAKGAEAGVASSATGGGDGGVGGFDSGNGEGDDDEPDLFGDDTSGGNDGGAISPGLPEINSTYPAVTPDMATISNNGGAILTAPHIVTVVWKDDPNREGIEAFGAALGGSSYWSTTTSEYGIAAATSENFEITTAIPAALSDDDIDSMVESNVSKGVWPAKTDQTMYVVYVPQTTHFQATDPNTGDLSDACQTELAYHAQTNEDSESMPHYPYAVIPEICGLEDDSVPTLLASLTSSASHETVEGVTDPLPVTSPGLLYFDVEHLSFELFNDFQDEVADACEFYAASTFVGGSDLPYYLKRTWSNAAALAGHNPCVPEIDGQPNFNVSLTDPEEVTVRFSDGSRATSEGYRITPGTTRTIPFTFYSDAPTNGGWFLTAAEGDGVNEVTPSMLSIKVDTPQGVNGQTGSITVTVNSVGETTAQLVTLRSKQGGIGGRYMPILIGAY